jgi:organic hydroperoxide reductase OsmC/OhrA
MDIFPLTLDWHGSTAGPYPREGAAGAPGKPAIVLSAGAAYGGDPAQWNPEDLLGASLAQCHMLTFLALAAKTRVDVRSYADRPEVVLETVDKAVAGEIDAARLGVLFEKAHKYCFIGNSITAVVEMRPRFVPAE